MRTTIVIPTYNERENLRPLIERIARLRIPDSIALVVDDNSPDETGALAEELAREFPFVRVLHRPRKEGLGAAYLAGFQRALGDGTEVIVQMDADGSHDPVDIPRMIARLDPTSLRVAAKQSHTDNVASGIASSPSAPRNDLIVGSRRVPSGRIVGRGFHRRFMSWTAQALSRHLLGLRTRDITSGFRVWRADALRAVIENGARGVTRRGGPPARASIEHAGGPQRQDPERVASGYAFQEELLYRAEQSDLRIAEHPITFRDRERGRSKLGWRDVLGFFRTCARLWWSDRDHRFAIWLGIALVLLTGLPYLYGWWRTPPGFTYTGLHAIGGGDAHVYYSYIEQARDGALAFRDLFTSEPNAPLMTQLPWLAVGLIARAFQLSAPLAFHLVRILLIVPYVLFLAVFTSTIIRTPIAGWSVERLRRAALLLIVFGGGVGGLFGAAFLQFVYDTPAYSAWPLDFGIPEAFTFLTVYQSPHFIISTWLLLAVYLATVRAAATGRARYTIIAAITAAVLAQFHPFYIPLIVAIVGVHALVRMIAARRWIATTAMHACWTSLAMLPAFAYWWPIAVLDPIHASRTAQNTLLMPPPIFVLAGYGFLLPLAIIGFVALLRRASARRTPEVVFLCTWAVVNALMLYAPLAWQRRFTQGFSIALALLAAIGIAACVAWMRARLTPAWYTRLCNRMLAATLFVLLLSFTHLVNIGRDLAYFTMRFPTQDPKFMFYYPTAGLDAMRWLRTHAAPNDVTLALGVSANFIPGWAARPTYVGHDIETVRIAEKKRTILALIDPATPPEDARAILHDMRVRYLFVPSFEPPAAHLARIAETLALPRAYANDAVAIYRIPNK